MAYAQSKSHLVEVKLSAIQCHEQKKHLMVAVELATKKAQAKEVKTRATYCIFQSHAPTECT